MVQRCEDFCLALEASEMVRIARDRRRQHFESHLTFQVGIGRAIHLAHPACSEWGDHFIRTEANAWGERQSWETWRILQELPQAFDLRA
jgi:hypothetical protein